jgi:tetratricopeptide (TPR) repeat protein
LLRAVPLLLLALSPAFAQTPKAPPAPKTPPPPARAAAPKPNPNQPTANRANPSDDLGELDCSPTTFAILAALNAAGYDEGIDSPSNSSLRQLVRDYLSKQQMTVLPELRSFVREHRPRGGSSELSQYLSFALVNAGAPRFEPARPDLPMPPDAAPLYELSPLLAAFYVEAHLDQLWQQVKPYCRGIVAEYQEPVADMILQSNAYLRNPSGNYLGRRFQILIEPLAAPNQVQLRYYIDDYFAVITPHAEPPIQEIRHAYLRYLLDPLGVKFADEIAGKKSLFEYAQIAPALPELYKSDFNLMATECLIKAVESRMDHNPAAADQAMREGFVLTPAFAEQLAVYEKQDVALRLFLPDMLEKIDPKKEKVRLANIKYVDRPAARTVRPAITAPAAPEPVLTGAVKTLADAEKAYEDHAFSDRNMAAAKELYLRVLQESDQNPVHARAYYGLARIAVLERDGETGDRLFRKTLELEPDAETRSWSLLYLGRLADSQSDREQAQQFYQQALAVPGLPDQVKEAAQKGLQEPYTNSKK